MVCIYCHGETRVTNSRPQKRSGTTWRRRQCLNCHTIFTSIEKADLSKSIVVRKPKALEPFSRDKLLLSVYDCLKHRKTAETDASALTDTIISRSLAKIVDYELERRDLIKTVRAVLKRFDSVAEVHYTAFHPLD